MNKVRVRVTASDIKNGTRRSGNSCAIAKAVARVVYPGARVSVNMVGCISVNMISRLTSNQNKVRKFVMDFDSALSNKREHLKPFSFTLYL